MTVKNIFYAQSGGPTAVINNSACGVIETAKQYPNQIGKVFAGHNGIIGAIKEELIDTFAETNDTIAALQHCPGAAFGSCLYNLKDPDQDPAVYQRLFEVFSAHNIGTFFYNGGGDSQDTVHKISKMSLQQGYPLTYIGIPKTIDNDLAFTDNCPGYGSSAKYIATSILEASLDVASMSASSTKVFVLEVMGRHAGWIAAAGGMAQNAPNDPPQIILFPEVPFDEETFLKKVQQSIEQRGFCSIVVSEGVKNKQGKFLSDSGNIDAFGHHQLGGVAPIITNLITNRLGLKCHWAVSDYLQRSARHIASQTDADQAYALGKAAVEFALQGKNNLMLTIDRVNNTPYQWNIGSVPLQDVANIEKKMPVDFIREDGFGITDNCRAYISPLMQGEAIPPYKNGIPSYPQLKKIFAPKKCVSTCSH